MKSHIKVRLLAVLLILPLLTGTRPTGAARPAAPLAPNQPAARSAPLIIDHHHADITAIPQQWIEAAKNDLHIAYGHTSHGSQLTTGMNGLVDFANGNGLGLALPDDIFAWNHGGAGGALDLHDYAMGGDVGYYPQWENNTRAYLGDPNPATGRGTTHPDTNVVIWSWCGQANDRTEQEIIDTYLEPMSQLELDYPGIVFVYMTGHAEGTGEEGNLHLRNQQIREYAIANNKVLYDFYDIEMYDPDGNYYGDKRANDNCDYDSDGNGSHDKNWALDWQTSHTENTDWYDCDCAHSQALNCNQKAYSVWALWAGLAGWNSGSPTMAVSAETATLGQHLTYTLVVRDTGAPLTATVMLTSAVPAGLAYIPGSLTATGGTTDAANAPTLTWTGVLSPTPVVTVTYQVSVTTAIPQVITSTTVLVAAGAAPIARTASVTILRPTDYPDLTPSTKTVSPPTANFGDVVTYTVGVHNATGPLSLTATMTDVLHAGLSYVPGSLTATTGLVDDAAAPLLHWTGTLSPTPHITITYAAVVTYPVPGSTIIIPSTIVNTAYIAAPNSAEVQRTATLQTHLYHVYLPVIMRQN